MLIIMREQGNIVKSYYQQQEMCDRREMEIHKTLRLLMSVNDSLFPFVIY